MNFTSTNYEDIFSKIEDLRQNLNSKKENAIVLFVEVMHELNIEISSEFKQIINKYKNDKKIKEEQNLIKLMDSKIIENWRDNFDLEDLIKTISIVARNINNSKLRYNNLLKDLKEIAKQRNDREKWQSVFKVQDVYKLLSKQTDPATANKILNSTIELKNDLSKPLDKSLTDNNSLPNALDKDKEKNR